MNRIKLNIFIIGIFFLCSDILTPQENSSSNDSKYNIGFISGYGNQSLLNVNYDYRVIFFHAQLYYTFIDKSTWSMEILVQPQYNITKFRHVDTLAVESNGYEFGLNAGVLARKNLFEDFLSLYILISAGPHYVSGTPEIQARGFVFSDNFFTGLTVKLNENVHLDLRSGFRHISNASLKKPNGGVNNVILSGGILLKLNR